MDDSASVSSTSCLAISEKRSRTTGGCVGIFFQLFDWNRRFAKNKLFSKRLLPPDCAKDASKKFGGDEKRPKLRLIADENRGSFPNKNKNGVSRDNTAGNNGVQTPSLVARLMGLESMPSVQHDKLLTDSSCGFTGGRRQKQMDVNDEFDNKSAKQDFRPQKLRKTGTVDRRTVNRIGAEALQFKNVLSRSKSHHPPKLATPVKNANHHSKKKASRLIGAATRVLESGLQARNKSRYAITCSTRNTRKGENVDLSCQNPMDLSCKNCGNLIDISDSKPKTDVHPSVLNSSYDQDHESHSQTQSRIRAKVPRDTKLDTMGKFECVQANSPFRVEKRQLTRNGPRGVGNARSPRQQIGSVARKPDYQVQNGNKSSDVMAFRFNSSRKNQNATKFTSKQSEKKICLQKPFPLTGESLGALIEEKLQELRSRVRYDSRINGNPPKRKPVTIFQELLFDKLEISPNRNLLPHHNTRFCLQPKSEKAVWFIGRRNSDHLSPGSVLEASFSNDSCCSSILEDSSARTHPSDSISCSNKESEFEGSETNPNPFYSGVLFRKDKTHHKLVVDLLTYISQVLSTIPILHSGTIQAHIKQVIFNSELVLTNQTPHNPNQLNPFFICDLLLQLDTIADIIFTQFGNFLGGYQLKRFVFDSIIEYLESNYVRHSKCGFTSWNNLPPFLGFELLIQQVVLEVRRWMGFDGVTSVEMEMSDFAGKWIDFEVEMYEIGATIESNVVQILIDEVVVDILQGR